MKMFELRRREWNRSSNAGDVVFSKVFTTEGRAKSFAEKEFRIKMKRFQGDWYYEGPFILEINKIEVD